MKLMMQLITVFVVVFYALGSIPSLTGEMNIYEQIGIITFIVIVVVAIVLYFSWLFSWFGEKELDDEESNE